MNYEFNQFMDPQRDRELLDAHAERCVFAISPFEHARAKTKSGQLGGYRQSRVDDGHYNVPIDPEIPEEFARSMFSTVTQAIDNGKSCPECFRHLSSSLAKGFWYCKPCGYEWRPPAMSCFRCRTALSVKQKQGRINTTRRARRAGKPYPSGPFCSTSCYMKEKVKNQ